VRKPEEREAFIASLLSAAVPGVRQSEPADRPARRLLCQVAQVERLREAVSQSRVHRAMSRLELAGAIDRPLALGNWQIQQGLIEVILATSATSRCLASALACAARDLAAPPRPHPDSLRLYRGRWGARAVAQTAEAVFQRMPEKQQEVARSIFLRMAEVGRIHRIPVAGRLMMS